VFLYISPFNCLVGVAVVASIHDPVPTVIVVASSDFMQRSNWAIVQGPWAGVLRTHEHLSAEVGT
jgi:hypothetical protein